MIRVIIITLVFAVFTSSALAAVSPYALGAGAGVNSNPHNLSRLNTGGVGTIKANDPTDPNSTRICVFCHTPHGATPESQLWGRYDPVTPSFSLYNAAGPIVIRDTQQAISGYNSASEYPNGASKLCLSCHDGATAIGTMVNDVIISMNQDTITDPQMVFDSTSLGNTHPISFIYNASLLGPLNAQWGAGAYVNNSPHLDGQQRMQCTTCHDPHFNSDMVDGVPRGGAGTYDLPFWRGAGLSEAAEYDAICNGCHSSTPGSTPGDPHGI